MIEKIGGKKKRSCFSVPLDTSILKIGFLCLILQNNCWQTMLPCGCTQKGFLGLSDRCNKVLSSRFSHLVTISRKENDELPLLCLEVLKPLSSPPPTRSCLSSPPCFLWSCCREEHGTLPSLLQVGFPMLLHPPGRLPPCWDRKPMNRARCCSLELFQQPGFSLSSWATQQQKKTLTAPPGISGADQQLFLRL